ncbi:MAG: DNA-3-methyladenine glycosylase [Candidatus Saccharimonadales bacterium]
MNSKISLAVEHLIKNDVVLAAVIRNNDLPRFSPHTQYYQELVSSIVSQQLSVKAAATIQKRFVDNLFDGAFPTPKMILTYSIEQLRSVGLSRGKATYIQDLARHIIDGTLQLDGLNRLSNDEIIQKLTQVKGIGTWTAHMFLMFCMGRLDILPVGDLGIRNGIKALYKFDDIPTIFEVEDVAKKYNWHPYESVAAWYVWRSLENVPILVPQDE